MSNMLIRLIGRRNVLAALPFTRSAATGPDKAVTKSVDPPKEEPEDVHDVIHRRTHLPNKLERRLLVWTGRYKSLEEVPKTVTIEALEKARNKARIRIANYMMVLTLIACLGVAISGRRAAERGESLTKMNLDWHKKINEGK